MRAPNPFPESLLALAREQTASAEERLNELRSQLEFAISFQQFWHALTSLLDRGMPLHVLDRLNKEAELLEKMRASNDPALSSLEEIRQIAKKQADNLDYWFPARLEPACRAANLKLDSDSRHPHYKFEKGFFKLDVDDKKGTASLSDYEEKLGEFLADIDTVVEAVTREYKRVFGRPFDGNKFLKEMRTQYLAIVKKEGKLDGESIPIRHITRNFSKNRTSFRIDEFLIDLSRLVEHGPYEIDGRSIDLQSTRDTKRAIFLHGRGYVGFILFKKGVNYE